MEAQNATTVRKNRKTIKWFLLSGILVALAIAVTLMLPPINEARTITSLKKLADYPLYSMTYYGDYHLDYTVDSPNLHGNGEDMLCSSFLATDENGEPILCRNLDYTLTGHPIAMVKTGAPGKQATLAICDLFYLGYRGDRLPTGSTKEDRALLHAPRVTIDGMNEHGVALAILSVPHAEPANDPAKETIDEVAGVRLVLDNATTVEEAIAVIKGYNIRFQEGAAHFMIADSTGSSAILEFINGETVVTRSNNPWQVATNYIVASPTREGVGQDRYDLAEQALAKSQGILTEGEAFELLSRISQEGTLWSVVYHLKSGKVSLVLNRDFDTVYRFQLGMD